MKTLNKQQQEALEPNQRAIKGFDLAKAQLVQRIPPITRWQLWKVQSQTTQTIVYDVVQKDNGELECSCPDFHSKRTKICKHMYACLFSEILLKK